MLTLISILYFILILIYVVIYFFIIYHLVKYSLKPSLNSLVLPVFVIGSTLFLAANIVLFFMVDWQGLLMNFPGNLK